ncbi:hypothetical protein PthBH41_06140 [Parageobacillus thermoglucosidasius]|nr:hypothetical protein PthBH41_06140 [Parageobacillus thermoglucosidasius]
MLEIFIEDCELRNLREHTIKYYRSELNAFVKLLKEQEIELRVSEWTGETIKRNVIMYMKEKGLKTVSINSRLRAMRAFFNFLEGRNLIKINPMKDIKLLKDRKRIVETFDNQQIKALFKACDLRTFVGLRDYTIMMLLLEVKLLSEIGSFSHYQDPCQLLKLAGLTLREHSSGQHKGQKRISKRGRRRLRALLFRVMMPMIRHNEAFRQLHDYYTTRPDNPLRKKQSIVVLCGKLLKVLHAVCTKHQAFDAKRVMQDIFGFETAA